jgi:hypothetical protein
MGATLPQTRKHRVNGAPEGAGSTFVSSVRLRRGEAARRSNLPQYARVVFGNPKYIPLKSGIDFPTLRVNAVQMYNRRRKGLFRAKKKRNIPSSKQ